MNNNQKLSLSGRIKSFYCAFKGIRVMIKSQHNAWIHAAATVIVVSISLYFRLTTFEWCWIILAITVVWTAEALNTAFEFLADVASPEFHPLVRNTKDVAAGAVLISALGSVAIGFLIIGPYLKRMIM